MARTGLTEFCTLLLKRAGHAQTLEILKPHMHVYKTVFTHASADPESNYEYFEFIGDSIINTCMVQYVSKKFPCLQKPAAIKILARLKIILISKQFLANLAQKLKMQQYIVTNTAVNTSMLEDVFEAFIGCTAHLVNEKVAEGFGYVFCYRLIENIMQDEYIPTDYESLFDARTRIKELLDVNKHIGKLEFTCRLENGQVHTKCTLFKSDGADPTILAEARGNSKAEAVQKTSERAILVLKSMGYERVLSESFQNLLDQTNK